MQVFGADHGSVMAFEDRGRLTGWERNRAKVGDIHTPPLQMPSHP